MYRFVYTSRAIGSLSQENVVDVARQAASINILCGVTGLLLYDGHRFIQAIEGDHGEVDKIMARIRVDGRHHHLAMVSAGPIKAREFGNWSMDYRRPTDCGVSSFLTQVELKVAAVSDRSLQAAFIGFASLATQRFG